MKYNILKHNICDHWSTMKDNNEAIHVLIMKYNTSEQWIKMWDIAWSKKNNWFTWSKDNN